MSAQRFRVWFRKGERVRYISHLDVLRAWERAIRRTGLPLAYSQGFTPHPKIAFASPLPLGFIGECEVMDVTLDERVDVDDFRARLKPESSDDLAVVDIAEVALTVPPPQAALLWADYRVDVTGIDLAEANAAIGSFLGRSEFPWTEERKDKAKTYNLRSAVASLSAAAADGAVRLDMRLQADQEMTARPEQVVAAIFPRATAGVYSRVGLVIDEPSPARDAWRRKGQYVG
jgi:radical SAM-linked protein